MSFHSDNDTSGLGYMVTVVQQECPLPSCDVTFKESDFTLTSPNFPQQYENSRTCRYTVLKSAPGVCRLHLQVKVFDVEEDDHCLSDYLEVHKDRLCGTMAQGQIVDVDFHNETLILQFQSDHVTTRDGFQLEAHQEECMTSPVASETSEATVSQRASDVTVVENSTPEN